MSDRFKFRLGRLLSLRERAQDRAASALADSLAVTTRIEASRNEAARIGTDARLRMLTDVGDAHQAGDVAAMQWLSECADARVAALATQLSAAEVEAERCRNELMLRTREKRVLERLREKQAQDHREEHGRRAQSAMDDVALRITTDRLSETDR
jgi:flagellar FliJ protein